MANWKLVIDASALWRRHDELTAHEFTKELVRQLKDVQPRVATQFGEDVASRLDDLISDFECSIDDESTYDDVDYVLSDLYNWADDNLVWLETSKMGTR